MQKILVTGAAGFIGFHTSRRLCKDGYQVVGIDTINDYYSVQLKIDRLNQLKQCDNFDFYTISITDKDSLFDLFEREKFDIVINLAAQAGVRFSIDKPYKYLDANLIGFLNVLEACRKFPVQHLLYASSSSVYGANEKIPFSEKDHTDHPVSLYAATKKANEMMAHSYASLYKIPCTGLRFFTVYGPWGRPDMAYFKFLNAIYAGETIDIYNNGEMQRDFTYVDDVVKGIVGLLDKTPGEINSNPSTGESKTGPYKILNIGNNQPVSLLEFINTLEAACGKTALKNMMPMQKGDVPVTYADVQSLNEETGYKPSTHLKIGLTKFVKWYDGYYQEEI